MTEERTPEGQARSSNREERMAAAWDALEKGPQEQPEPEKASDLPGPPEVDDEPRETQSGEEPTEEPVEAREEEEGSQEEPDYNEPAPERWPEEMKEVYNQLPPEGRKLVLENLYKPMQAKYTQTTMQLAEQRKAVEQLAQLQERLSGTFGRMGVDPMQALQQQAAWAEHYHKVGPEQWAKDLAEAYDVAPSADGRGQQDEYLTPLERQMREEMNGLKQTVEGMTQAQQDAQRQQQEQQQQAMAQQARQSFLEFVNAEVDGKPANPHAKELAPQMVKLLDSHLVNKVDESGQMVPFEKQISQAYQLAVNLNGTQQRQPQSGNGQVSRAKSANQTVVTKKPASGNRPPPSSDRETRLAATYDRLAARRG